MRLRQIALVAKDLEAVASQLQQLLGLPDPYRDPNIIEFGLANVVFPVGDTFLEVVSPVQEKTTAGRYLERRGGDGGYMVILQVDDIDPVRARMPEIGVRVVWQSDHERIRGTHLHPADVGGAILSIDDATPPETWDWAGRDWPKTVDRSITYEITAVELEAINPEAMARRWSLVLDRPTTREQDGWKIPLDRGKILFMPAGDRGDGVAAVHVTAINRRHIQSQAERIGLPVDGDSIQVAGVRVVLQRSSD